MFSTQVLAVQVKMERSRARLALLDRVEESLGLLLDLRHRLLRFVGFRRDHGSLTEGAEQL